MKENEAIQELESRISPYDTCKADFDANEAIKTAIKALKEVQQYRALEKRLSDMFCSSTSLKIVVDELERNLKEPGSPHPMKARILTYKESADWDAYRAIGTPEELKAAMKYVYLAKKHGTVGQVIENCVKYEEIGTPEECREAVEKQTDEKPTAVLGTFGGTEYECKNCGSDVCYGDEYCQWCGQKLDWSDVE